MLRHQATALALVALLAAAGCSSEAPRNSAGAVTASASTNAFAIKIGDCTGKLATGTIEGADLLPCDQKHYYEVYAASQMTDADFPGNEATGEQAEKVCKDEFIAFIGVTPSKSKYEQFYLSPTAESWTLGDREILCLVGSDNGGISGSLRGVKK